MEKKVTNRFKRELSSFFCVQSRIESKIVLVLSVAYLNRKSEIGNRKSVWHEPNQPVLASVEASTLTISVLVWHSHEFVDRGLYLEI